MITSSTSIFQRGQSYDWVGAQLIPIIYSLDGFKVNPIKLNSESGSGLHDVWFFFLIRNEPGSLDTNKQTNWEWIEIPAHYNSLKRDLFLWLHKFQDSCIKTVESNKTCCNTGSRFVKTCLSDSYAAIVCRVFEYICGKKEYDSLGV